MIRSNIERSVLVVIGLVWVALPAVPAAGAIPPDPDNAALLYYQALLTMPNPDSQTEELLRDVARGDVLPDQVRTYLEKCHNTIEFVEAAADVPTCHWGFRFSQGLDLQMPQLSQIRRLAFVLVADARLHAFDG